jgi:endoglucanase
MAPKIGSAQIRLLEKLCNTCAISGQEGPIRKIVLDELKDYADHTQVDSMGNVLITRIGTSENRLRVMVAAHMDEVGFMIVKDDGDGLYRFDKVGGLDDRQLAGKRIVAGSKDTPGVIGAPPIHLTTAAQRKNTMGIDSLCIDLGPKTSTKLKPGDGATFVPNFTVLGKGNSRKISAKALDDRVGVATLIELVKNAPENIDLLAAFTVQEEVGLRGARVAGYAFNPDLAIALDCTPAYDLPHHDPDEENTRYNTQQGLGPAIYMTDGATLNDPRLVRHLAHTGETNKIPYQFRQPGGGGTDAGAIHKVRAGVPSVSVSVPGRYLHTAAGMIALTDWKNSVKLVYTALSTLPSDFLASERA